MEMDKRDEAKSLLARYSRVAAAAKARVYTDLEASLLAACEWGGHMMAGPDFLRAAASVVEEAGWPATAMDLRQKANMEEDAINEARLRQ